MYAVIQTGGKQYRVQAGHELVVDLLTTPEGQSVSFDQVLLVGSGPEVRVGHPRVAGCAVRATVLTHFRGPKIKIFKMRRRKHYRKTIGHRQPFTRVRIEEITG